MAVYFIADTHFGHQNALAFDNRKFKTIEEHDNTLIENWNNAVGIDDEVFIPEILAGITQPKRLRL